MTIIGIASQKGTEAVKRLRERKLRSGLPFMINARELATSQCYLEYPNGVIKLVSGMPAAGELDVIRELTPGEANSLRRRFRFAVVR